jgi:hypothetical protein
MPAAAAELRTRCLNKPRRNLVSVLDKSGTETGFFVRPLTIAQRSQIMKAAKIAPNEAGGAPVVDLAGMQVAAMIEAIVDSTGTSVFSPLDLEALLNCELDAEMEMLSAAAMKQVNVDQETIAKN